MKQSTRPRVPKMKLRNGFEIRYKQVLYDNRYFFLYQDGLERFKVPSYLVKRFGIQNIFYAFLTSYDLNYTSKMVEAFEGRVYALDKWLDAN